MLFLQVTALESIVSKGGKVAEKDVLNLIELLMTQLIRLDAVTADGDTKLQRRMQVWFHSSRHLSKPQAKESSYKCPFHVVLLLNR